MVHASNRSPIHDASHLVEIFENCFRCELNTRLLGGGDEPVYLPRDKSCAWDRVIFTRDYFASALHEVAHWCVAGESRRTRIDYGYWYAPDGRNASQQHAFEQVEIYPQALEWIFSEACAYRFRISTDNITQNMGASSTFTDAVARRARILCHHGLPGRAHRFAVALSRFYSVAGFFRPERYRSNLLREASVSGYLAP